MTTPVVLLHGWGGSFASTWIRHGWIEALGLAGHTALEINLPGHGSLEAPHEPEAYTNLTALVECALPEDPIDIIAYSLGAKIALALASRQPSRIRRLVVAGVGDNLFAPEPSGEALAAALEQTTQETTPRALAALVHYAAEAGGDRRALAAVLRRPPNPVVAEDELAAVGPVLLVNGGADQLAVPDDRLRAALRSLSYLSLPNVGHLGIPASLAFQKAAISFLHMNVETPPPNPLGVSASCYLQARSPNSPSA